jgi:hypothetical protein
MGMRLDLMVKCKRPLKILSFNECLALAAIADLGTCKSPFFAHKSPDRLQKSSNRPKDQTDVIYLEKIKELLKEEENK